MTATTSLRVVSEEGQDIFSHGYRRKVKEHFIGVVKLGKKLQKNARLFIGVLWGVPGFFFREDFAVQDGWYVQTINE